jgi:5,10-methylenetetrahydromethanopterin reductase
MSFAVELAGIFEPADARDIIDQIEGLGYDHLYWADYRFYRDVYPMLALTALRTQRVGFGTLVTDPFARHPAMTAAAMATVDELGGNRATMAIGAGVSGLHEMGITRHRPAARISEAVDLIRELWRDGHAHYHGEILDFDGCLGFTPRADIPIYIASNSPATLGIAGAKANGVIVEGLRRPLMRDYVVEHVDRGLHRAGRSWHDLQLVARLDLAMHEDRDTALHAMRKRVQHYVSVHGSQRWPDLAELVPKSLEDDIRAAGFTHDPATIDRLASRIPLETGPLVGLAGTDDDIAQQIHEVHTLGVDQISVFPVPTGDVTIPKLLNRFAKVMRRLQ